MRCICCVDEFSHPSLLLILLVFGDIDQIAVENVRTWAYEYAIMI